MKGTKEHIVINNKIPLCRLWNLLDLQKCVQNRRWLVENALCSPYKMLHLYNKVYKQLYSKVYKQTILPAFVGARLTFVACSFKENL